MGSELLLLDDRDANHPRNPQGKQFGYVGRRSHYGFHGRYW